MHVWLAHTDPRISCFLLEKPFASEISYEVEIIFQNNLQEKTLMFSGVCSLNPKKAKTE